MLRVDIKSRIVIWPPDNVTEEDHLSGTVGKAEHSLVLSSEGDEVLHGWLRTPLGHRSEELTSLGETNGVVTLLQLRVIADHLTHLGHLGP